MDGRSGETKSDWHDTAMWWLSLPEGARKSYPAEEQAENWRMAYKLATERAIQASTERDSAAEKITKMHEEIEFLENEIRRLRRKLSRTKSRVKVETIPMLEDLVEECSMLLRIGIKDIRGRSRMKHIANARHIIAYVLKRTYPTIGYSSIGQAMRRDHSTMVHGVRRVENDPVLKKKAMELIEKIKPKESEEWLTR